MVTKGKCAIRAFVTNWVRVISSITACALACLRISGLRNKVTLCDFLSELVDVLVLVVIIIIIHPLDVFV